MSYIAKGRYIDSTNRNGTFEIEVPSQDRRHIIKVVENRYVAKKVIVNSVAPSPSMLAQQHAERVRQQDEERRQRANTPSSNFASSVGPTYAHPHPPQQSSGGSAGIVPMIILGLVAMLVMGESEESTTAPAPAPAAAVPETVYSVPTRPSENIGDFGAPDGILTLPEPSVAAPAPIFEVPAPPTVEVDEPGFIDIRDQRRNGRDR